jgi:hypothetical protein
MLELDPEHVDLHRFQRLVRDGARTLRPAQARAASTLREALGLWHGQPLAEFAEEPFARAEPTGTPYRRASKYWHARASRPSLMPR